MVEFSSLRLRNEVDPRDIIVKIEPHMRCRILLFASFLVAPLHSQNMAVHYDSRSALAPQHSKKNSAPLYFEYFNSQDSKSSALSLRSFPTKFQLDPSGVRSIMGKFYVQIFAGGDSCLQANRSSVSSTVRPFRQLAHALG